MSEIPFPYLTETEREDFLSIRKGLGNAMKNISSHHGFKHANTVAEYGGYLALAQEGNPYHVMLAGLLHDIRWWDDEERRIRKITPLASEIIETKSTRDILEDLYSHGHISANDYGDMMRAVRRHSLIPDREFVSTRLTMRCLRDADRLSRGGVEGLLSILEANEYHVPFYKPGEPVIKRQKRGVLPYDTIESCIDDIHICGNWRNVMETEEGKRLANALYAVNDVFLETFTKYSHLIEYAPWIAWLKHIVQFQSSKKPTLQRNLEEGDIHAFRKKLLEIENPKLVSVEEFERFRKNL